ncbi:2-hydroxy-6-oxononadienedioate/2-hydroxy-6-oxononatrienedioate hydrolase [Striga asiatica]|uniref:2-hydroxy-6-oxononadienedioate/2-hydroxy-6-oxononatrienedioate hydrolase n=1 Tax=Striga asiatica TaxID=4170 RepID=A0A5A7QCM0_STRAF|nr:2-hydroxy-6-oxononadienedioate/2-hydroxy-6-oxononatrienedioate hydrolase [Striga asiatica]
MISSHTATDYHFRHQRGAQLCGHDEAKRKLHIGECGEKDDTSKAGIGQGPTEIGRLSGQNSCRSGYTRQLVARLEGCLDKLNWSWALVLSKSAGSGRVSSEGKRKDLSLRISKSVRCQLLLG